MTDVVTGGRDVSPAAARVGADITFHVRQRLPGTAVQSAVQPMRGLRIDRTAQVIIAGHAFMQNLRRGHYELAVDAPGAKRVAVAFTDLASAI